MNRFGRNESFCALTVIAEGEEQSLVSTDDRKRETKL